MAKIFNWDGRKGTLRDTVNDKLGTLTAASFIKTSKGYALKALGSSAQLAFTVSNTFQSSNHTYEFWYYKDRENYLYNGLFGKNTASASTKGIRAYTSDTGTTASIYIGDGSATAGLTISNLTKGFTHLVITVNWTTNLITLYIDGQYASSNSISSITAANVNNSGSLTMFDNPVAVSSDVNSHFLLFSIYDTALSTSEIAKLYADFVASKPIDKPKRGFTYPKPTDLRNVPGLVAAYNMKPNGLTLTDISGNGYNGTITQGVTTTKDGIMMRQGQAITTTSMPIEGDFTIAFRIKWLTSGSISNIMRQNGSGTSNIWVYRTALGELALDQNTGGSSITSSGLITARTEEDWVITFNDTTNVTSWYRNTVAVSSAGTYNPSGSRTATVLIGNISSSDSTYTLKDELKDLRIYNRILTTQEIKDYHNSFAKQVYLQEDFSNGLADGNTVVPMGWEKVSGTWKIGEYQPTNGELSSGSWQNNYSVSFDTFSSTGQSGFTGSSATTENDRAEVVASMTVGKKYKASFDISFSNCTITLASATTPCSGTTGLDNGVKNVSSGHNEIEFTLTATSTRLMFVLASTGAPSVTVTNFKLQEIDPLTNFIKGQKYLENVTVGVISIPSNQAYGTWEFDYYKGLDSTSDYIKLASNNNEHLGTESGYDLRITSDEAIYFYRRDAGFPTVLVNTDNDYLKIYTWYRIKITRTTSGSFTFLIKGGSFTPTAGYGGYTLITMATGYTNPETDTTYTSGNYLIFKTDGSSRITNIKLTKGITQ